LRKYPQICATNGQLRVCVRRHAKGECSLQSGQWVDTHTLGRAHFPPPLPYSPFVGPSTRRAPSAARPLLPRLLPRRIWREGPSDAAHAAKFGRGPPDFGEDPARLDRLLPRNGGRFIAVAGCNCCTMTRYGMCFAFPPLAGLRALHVDGYASDAPRGVGNRTRLHVRHQEVAAHDHFGRGQSSHTGE